MANFDLEKAIKFAMGKSFYRRFAQSNFYKLLFYGISITIPNADSSLNKYFCDLN